jgi:Holliday junction resolvasome RuvABC ATP-dependent DNA helicase subunit
VRYRFNTLERLSFFSKEELNEILKGTGWNMSTSFDDEEIDQYIAVIVHSE